MISVILSIHLQFVFMYTRIHSLCTVLYNECKPVFIFKYTYKVLVCIVSF